MLVNKFNQPAGIQYLGLAGVSRDCVEAIIHLIQSGARIRSARILSWHQKHGLILFTEQDDLIGIKTGFASGYPGEGPKSFAYALSLLDLHDVDIEEIDVAGDLLDRLDRSALTVRDVEGIRERSPIRPTRWSDYLYNMNRGLEGKSHPWEAFDPVVPFAIVDARLEDVVKDFWKDPDQGLLTAFRRLEDAVRQRTGSSEHGQKLFSQAFAPKDGPLEWSNLDSSEQIGRMNLFTAAYMAYRNPRAHRELNNDHATALAEFLLINHLYRLEREAVKRLVPPATSSAGSQSSSPP